MGSNDDFSKLLNIYQSKFIKKNLLNTQQEIKFFIKFKSIFKRDIKIFSYSTLNSFFDYKIEDIKF